MKTAAEVAQLFHDYQAEDHWRKAKMARVAEIADGDVAIPLPELNAVEAPAVVNLVHQGLQQMSQRLTSVQPVTEFMPLRLNKSERKAAEMRTRACDFWWQEDKTSLLDAQRGRYMFGYGTSPSRMDVHFGEERPTLSIPSPLSVYAPRPVQANDIEPAHGIAARQMSPATIEAMWPRPDVLLRLRGARPQSKYWVVEYNDAEETQIVLCGEIDNRERAFTDMAVDAGGALSLARAVNRTGMCLWVAPGLIHLNRPQGYFDQLMGMYHAQGLLTALELQQAARSVFQETWIVARPNETPEIITPADPIEGVVGEIRGGDIQTIAPDPQFATHAAQDRLQEAQRATAGLPSDFGGQSSTNVRTGRRAAQLTEAAVDPSLGEAQTIMALAKEAEIKRAIAIDKAYFGGRKKVFHLKWRGRATENEYVPNELWQTDKALVTFPVTGTDTNSLTILIGQLLGTEMISQETGRRLLPMIDDAEGEKDQIQSEKLERAFVEMVAQMSATPDSPIQPAELAKLIKKVRDNDIDIIDAFLEVQAEAQERQATPVEAGSPDAMPGMDGPSAVPPPVAGPQQGTQNLTSLLGALRMPERQMATSGGGRA